MTSTSNYSNNTTEPQNLKKMQASCQVCCETFNKSTLKPVKCSFCEFETCLACAKKYLVESMEDAHCMNCKREWTREMLIDLFPKSFVMTDYKKHRESILVEREKSLLPATQPYVEREIKMERLDEKFNDKWKQFRQVQIELSEIRDEIYKMKYKTIEKKNFVKKCPLEGCQGFLSPQWKCGLCETYVCPDCHEIKGDRRDAAHECKQENIESARMIEKDCRPCPKCATMIHKIDGCQQIWCVVCHTAFDYRTGRIETKIHNPHYFEWQRNQNRGLERNPMDIQCGREIDANFMNNMRKRIYDSFLDESSADKFAKIFVEICRCAIHIRMVELPRVAVDRVQDNLDLRIQFMRGKLPEEEWKKQLQQREKKAQRKRAIADILGMYIATLTDIVFRVTESLHWYAGLNEISKLVEYTQSHLDQVSKTFGNKSEFKQLHLTRRTLQLELESSDIMLY